MQDFKPRHNSREEWGGGQKQGDNQVRKEPVSFSTVSSINRPQWLCVLLSEPTPGEYLERVGWCSSPLLPR
jgi:hypothetical protein